jgi:hypothetical protein
MLDDFCGSVRKQAFGVDAILCQRQFDPMPRFLMSLHPQQHQCCKRSSIRVRAELLGPLQHTQRGFKLPAFNEQQSSVERRESRCILRQIAPCAVYGAYRAINISLLQGSTSLT